MAEPQFASSSPPGRVSVGVTQTDVDQAADALLRDGIRPSTEKIRAITGGSPNTINPKLDAWWKRLSSRIEAGPAALHRLPEAVLRRVEGLWLSLVEEARTRVVHESTHATRVHHHERAELDQRAAALSLREEELENRLRDRGQLIESLKSQLSMTQQQLARARKEQNLNSSGTNEPMTLVRKKRAVGKLKVTAKKKRAKRSQRISRR